MSVCYLCYCCGTCLYEFVRVCGLACVFVRICAYCVRLVLLLRVVRGDACILKYITQKQALRVTQNAHNKRKTAHTAHARATTLTHYYNPHHILTLQCTHATHTHDSTQCNNVQLTYTLSGNNIICTKRYIQDTATHTSTHTRHIHKKKQMKCEICVVLWVVRTYLGAKVQESKQ